MKIKSSLKRKLQINFLAIIVFTGVLSSSVGTYLINEGVINQAQDSVKNDLNAAHEIWNNKIDHLKNCIYYATFRSDIREALSSGNTRLLKTYLDEIRENGDFEILSITDKNGNVILRASNPELRGDSQMSDQLVKRVISQKIIAASPVIIKKDELEKEGKRLARRAQMKTVKSPGSGEGEPADETSGMMLKAAAPVWSNSGEFIGVLYGGDLINRNYDIVDRIKNTVYRYEIYKGIEMGAVTIFQRDIRIATTLVKDNGDRAIGTRATGNVSQQVLDGGRQWLDSAYAVNKWYITAYEPILDIDSSIIGIFGVGLLEDKFTNIRNITLLILFSITAGGIIIAIFVSNVFANKITRPLNYLVRVSRQMSGGDFAVKVDVKSQDELGELEKAYLKMAADLKERDEKLKIAMEKLEELSRTDPLTGILNRRAFAELAQIEIERAKRFSQPLSIAYIDLDNFKIVNDEFGHNTGDILLTDISSIVKSNIREIDYFGRLGGDEFTLLLSRTEARNAYEAISKLQKLLLTEMEKQKWPVTFSIGLVTFNTPPEDVEVMIKTSDEAMYKAKRGGKNMIMQIEIS